MVLIPVQKPPKSAANPDRAVNTLLRNQILHLQEAEFRLPLKLQTNVYVNAIKTEGEAADYIRRVTKALHKAHGVQPMGHAGPEIAVVRRPVRGPDIAAAEERPKRSKGAGKAKVKGRTKAKRTRK
ncbi:MAG: hypothetical protein LAO24_06475 [Acidobacteriia bacterium]|nr:hypothetical protein [Terriglobia bacterium]